MAFIMHVGCLVSFTVLSSLVTGQSVSSEDGSGGGLDSLYSSFSTNSTLCKSVSISSEVLADSPSGTPGGTFTVMTTSTEELLVPIPSSLLDIQSSSQPTTTARESTSPLISRSRQRGFSTMVAPTPVPQGAPSSFITSSAPSHPIQHTSTTAVQGVPSESVSTGLVIGVAVGVGCAVVIVILIIFLVFILVRYRRIRKWHGAPRKKRRVPVQKADSFVLHKINVSAFINHQQPHNI